MRTIADIIEDWKVECGTTKMGKNGPYRVINFRERKTLMFSLVQTMLDDGHSEETIRSTSTRNAVCNACSAPDFANITPKTNRKIKEISDKDWKDVLREFYHGPVSKYIPEDRASKYVPEVKEEVRESKPTKTKPALELEPSDRIKMVTTGFAESELDLDFLSELGITPEGAANE